MTPSTTPRLSMKPLTATRSMRFVLALYSVRSTVLAFSSTADDGLLPDDESALPGWTSVKVRRTRGEISASTWRALMAEEARRWVGKGV